MQPPWRKANRFAKRGCTPFEPSPGQGGKGGATPPPSCRSHCLRNSRSTWSHHLPSIKLMWHSMERWMLDQTVKARVLYIELIETVGTDQMVPTTHQTHLTANHVELTSSRPLRLMRRSRGAKGAARPLPLPQKRKSMTPAETKIDDGGDIVGEAGGDVESGGGTPPTSPKSTIRWRTSLVAFHSGLQFSLSCRIEDVRW